ncbi:MAG TPA: hypothetical protein VJ814_10375 [Gaiellaceae bacterium]|nr:hypothetical protein [Gaiellaceae bacterium]
MDPDPCRDVLRGELLLDADGRLHRRERAREHAHAPVAEPLDDRAAERLVVALERVEIALPLLDREALVRLEQRGVSDHVGEHHRHQPPLERSAHARTIRPGEPIL